MPDARAFSAPSGARSGQSHLPRADDEVACDLLGPTVEKSARVSGSVPALDVGEKSRRGRDKGRRNSGTVRLPLQSARGSLSPRIGPLNPTRRRIMVNLILSLALAFPAQAPPLVNDPRARAGGRPN